MIIDGMTGNLTVRSGKYITAKELYLYIHKELRRNIELLTEADDEGLFPRQDPVMFIPKHNIAAADYPVCCVCVDPQRRRRPLMLFTWE